MQEHGHLARPGTRPPARAALTGRAQGNRLASRGGFDTGLAHLDHYRGRDPVRAFGSSKLEHDVMVRRWRSHRLTGRRLRWPAPRSRTAAARRCSVISTRTRTCRRWATRWAGQLSGRQATTVEMLHSLRKVHADTDRLLRDRARVDTLHQPENRAAVSTQVESARYTPSRTPIPGHHRYFTTG